jgi:hypothetical protein
VHAQFIIDGGNDRIKEMFKQLRLGAEAFAQRTANWRAKSARLRTVAYLLRKTVE